MKKYLDLEMELVLFMQDDVVRTSGVGDFDENGSDVDGDDPYGDF